MNRLNRFRLAVVLFFTAVLFPTVRDIWGNAKASVRKLRMKKVFIETLRFDSDYEGAFEVSRELASRFLYGRVWGRDMKDVNNNLSNANFKYTTFQPYLEFDVGGKSIGFNLSKRATQDEADAELSASINAIKEFAAGGNPSIVIRADFSTTFEQKRKTA
jgi:hypothetical protein